MSRIFINTEVNKEFKEDFKKNCKKLGSTMARESRDALDYHNSDMVKRIEEANKLK